MGEIVKVSLLFFAKSRELVGQKEVQLQVPSACTGKQLLNHIVLFYPELSLISNNLVLSLNDKYLDIDENQVTLQENDELAVIPPISDWQKRMDHVDVVFDKLKVDEITDLVSTESCGAISLFVGTTRDYFEGKRVLHLEYEAYDSMAKKKMLEVCQAIREKWEVQNIAIIHRIGVVPVKEASIVIAISSAHRKESLEAVQFAIDTVKAVVPVWKKETYEDNTYSWKQNKECCWSGDASTPDSQSVNTSAPCNHTVNVYSNRDIL